MVVPLLAHRMAIQMFYRFQVAEFHRYHRATIQYHRRNICQLIKTVQKIGKLQIIGIFTGFFYIPISFLTLYNDPRNACIHMLTASKRKVLNQVAISNLFESI